MDDGPTFARDEATRSGITSQVRYLTSVRLRSEVAFRGCAKLLADRYQQLVYKTRLRDPAANFETDARSNRKLHGCDASTVCETALATASSSGDGEDRHLRCLLSGAEEKRSSPESGEAIKGFMVNAAGRAWRWNPLPKSENNWGGSAGECSSGRRPLWMSRHCS